MPDAAVTWGLALLAVLLVSAVSLGGAFLLTLRPRTLDDNLHVLVSFAAGALFGDAFIHLLPEAFERAENPLPVSLLILLGIFLFMTIERLILWRHGHAHGHGSKTAHGRAGNGGPGGVRPVVVLNLVGDAAHNLVDGLVIGASFLVSPSLGWTTALAVLLHEIPQELGDFGILVHGGMSHRKALGFNLLASVSAVIGVVASLLAGPHLAGYSHAMLPVTAGGFIYIAGSTLIPDVLSHVEPRDFLKELLAMAAGIGVMVGLTLLE